MKEMLTVPTYTAQQVREAEKPLLEARVPLMARASKALAHVAAGVLELTSTDVEAPRVLVLVGSGNNGGDALYAAAELAARGARVDALPVGKSWHEEGMAAALAAGTQRITHAEMTERLDASLQVAKGSESNVPAYDLIIDGIIGTGTSADPSLRGVAAEVVEHIWEYIDASGLWPQVIAVDVPSGLQPDKGTFSGTVLAADVTVTFGGVKVGLTEDDANWLVGEIVLARIGLEEELSKHTPVGSAEVIVVDLGQPK